MATSDGLLATCGVPPLAAPHATYSLAFNSFFTSEFQAVRSDLRPHRSCFCRSKMQTSWDQWLLCRCAGSFSHLIVNDSFPWLTASSSLDSVARSNCLRISLLVCFCQSACHLLH